MHAEQFTDPVAEHGEGPVWYPEQQTLRWVDMLAGDVLSRGVGSTAVRRHHVDRVAAVLRPRRDGGTIVAGESSFVLLDQHGRAERRVAVPGWRPGTRMNEGGCDPHGAFYAGSMSYQAAPGAGRLYRLTPDGAITVVLDAVTISNGLAWSPDGTLAYYVDTPTGRIDVFDSDPSAGLTGRRPLVEIPPERGAPDGLTVDADGHLWVALWDGAAVHRYTPDGRLDGVVDLPVRQVTACTFGGPDLDELYITTSRHALDDPEPAAGAVFRARVGVTGLPALIYHA
ncbi:SMP-30/gluconolactonase/LRE family protein [Actinoplanes sichuanensis]|uniref:SMP-30/gluconolactonase/LRE family protein n=1 Tax=Actinoplanes sichuanensis TaxID=512349 RepID=A0ABW4AUL1_9ACTN|nr:SMP-30/gluconolactonase/LRE family protein [Actinoplanes sichuanensis]BEL04423.1 SMP-30/gluconolactonase/LRE family protein [Actinoplanes sichuanensis]